MCIKKGLKEDTLFIPIARDRAKPISSISAVTESVSETRVLAETVAKSENHSLIRWHAINKDEINKKHNVEHLDRVVETNKLVETCHKVSQTERNVSFTKSYKIKQTNIVRQEKLSPCSVDSGD